MPEAVQQSQQDLINKLKLEKKQLEEKCISLAKIIEISAKQKPKTSEEAQNVKKAQDDLTAHLADMKKSLKHLSKKIENKPDGEGGNINEALAGFLKPLEEKLQNLEKLSTIETRISKIESAFNNGNKEAEQKPQEQPLFGGFQQDPVQEEADKKEMLGFQADMSKRIAEIENVINPIKILFTSKSVRQIEKLIEESGDIINEAIPSKVREEMDRILATASGEMRLVSQTLKKLNENVEKSSSDILYALEEIERIGSDLERLENRLDNLHRDLFRAARKK